MNADKMRCHPSIIFERSIGMIIITLIFLLRSLDDIVENFSEIKAEFGPVIIGSLIYLGIFLLVIVFNFISWFKTYIWIEDNMIIVERNTIFHKKNVYNISQISNIDVEQNLFEKILNTNKIKIDCNSSVTAKSTDIKIIFSKKKAEQFRNRVLNNDIEGKENSEIEEQNEKIHYDISFSKKDVIKHTLHNINITGIFFVLIGIAGAFGFICIAGEDESIENVVTYMIGGLFASLIIIVPAIYSIVKPFFRYYGFEISRLDDKLKLHYGLIKYNETTIPLEKINGVVIKQPLISRALKRYQVEIKNIGMDDEKQEMPLILLSCTKEELKKFIGILLPEYEDMAELQVKRQNKLSLVHYFYKAVIGSTILTFILFFVLNELAGLPIFVPAGIAVTIFILIIISCIFSYMAGGYYIASDYVIISRGYFEREYTMIAYKKMQKLEVDYNIVSRITKLNSTTCYITASLLKSIIHFPYLQEEDVEQISKGMKSTYCNI